MRPHLFFSVAALSIAFLFTACTSRVEYPARDASPLGGVRIAPPDSVISIARATGFTLPADGLDFTVHTPAAGLYHLDLTYSADSPKRIPVLVNGSMQGSLLLPATSGFQRHPFGRIPLAAGDNIVRIGTDWGYADIASIHLSRASAPREFRLRPAPVNPHASPEARALFATLTREFTHRTFTGQHESNPAAPSRLAQLSSLTGGSAPAVLGLDLIFHTEPWNRPDQVIETARDYSLNRGGIVTLSWHWLAPLGAREFPWESFSTAKNDFNFARISDESSPEYAAVLRDLDRIASHLAVLRDARVPVLWRPLHEAEGRWFWWGSLGPDATQHLYRLMFDRFTRVHRLDNLLWVWTSTADDSARDWYPGDNYVDIIAADLYFPPGTRGDFFTTFDRLRDLYRGRKPVALGECGVLPDLTADAPWLWFLAWDDFITRPDVNPAAHLLRTYAHPRALNLGATSAPPRPLLKNP